jgi:putative aminopeptidase FrvX
MEIKMRVATLDLLTELSNCAGPPGGEERVAGLIRKHLQDFSSLRCDGLGSLLAEKPGLQEGPRLLICAHMDEIGFMVQSITDKGFLRLQPLGGWNTDALAATRLVIHTGKGDHPAVIPAIPPHFKKSGDEKNQPEEVLADMGVFSREEALERGVMLGDLVTPAAHFECFGDTLVANKAWDDRAGCAAMVLGMEHLRGIAHPATVIAAATVQEEVGARGATTAVHMAAPDLAVVLEAAPADDLPGLAKDEPQGALGRGCQIRLYDPTTIVNRRFWKWARQLAADHNIPHQLAVRQSGSTDARPIHLANGGVPTLVLSTPVRYIHSPTALMHLADFAATVALLKIILESLDLKVADGIRSFAAEQ